MFRPARQQLAGSFCLGFKIEHQKSATNTILMHFRERGRNCSAHRIGNSIFSLVFRCDVVVRYGGKISGKNFIFSCLTFRSFARCIVRTAVLPSFLEQKERRTWLKFFVLGMNFMYGMCSTSMKGEKREGCGFGLRYVAFHFCQEQLPAGSTV